MSVDTCSCTEPKVLYGNILLKWVTLHLPTSWTFTASEGDLEHSVWTMSLECTLLMSPPPTQTIKVVYIYGLLNRFTEDSLRSMSPTEVLHQDLTRDITIILGCMIWAVLPNRSLTSIRLGWVWLPAKNPIAWMIRYSSHTSSFAI